MNHRQGFQAEEVELHQADLFDVSHRILGDDFVVGPLIERHMFRERLIGNDDAGRMGGGMARQAFERLGDRHQFLDLRILVDQFLKSRFLFERLVERHLQIVGHELRDPVHLGIGHLEHAADVANGRFCLHASRT